MGDFTLPVRAALVTLLRSDATILSIMGLVAAPARIYDNVPQETLFPYVRLGDEVITDWGDKSQPGQQFLESFHIFDRTPTDRGQKRINQIQARLYDLLHQQSTAVSGGSIYLSRFADQRVLTDDGLTWHGISTYRFLLATTAAP